MAVINFSLILHLQVQLLIVEEDHIDGESSMSILLAVDSHWLKKMWGLVEPLHIADSIYAKCHSVTVVALN